MPNIAGFPAESKAQRAKSQELRGKRKEQRAALGLSLFARCSLPFALRSLPFALCPLLFAPWPLPQPGRRVAEQYPCLANVGVTSRGLGACGHFADGQAPSAEQLADRFLIHEDLIAGIGHSR